MITRRLGPTDLEVSALGFGCAPLLSRAGGRESRAALDAALRAGITFFDTADFYGQGDSERALGRALARRSEAVIATKCGLGYRAALRPFFFLKPLLRPLVRRFRAVRGAASRAVSAGSSAPRFDPSYVFAAADASLKRLRRERLDVYLLHQPSADALRGGEALGALLELRRRGKVRWTGASCDADAALAGLEGAPANGLSVLEIAVNPLGGASMREALRRAAEKGVAVIGREPFGGGRVLSAPAVRAFAERRGIAPAEAALRYAIARPEVHVVLPSMIARRHLDENLRSLSLGPLPADQARELDEI